MPRENARLFGQIAARKECWQPRHAVRYGEDMRAQFAAMRERMPAAGSAAGEREGEVTEGPSN